ncbi:TPA: RDD family protein [Candidatus Falkowbacteria bacterium]|nr:RDD family protein [Candidatus Falkowbacteria bacterium]
MDEQRSQGSMPAATPMAAQPDMSKPALGGPHYAGGWIRFLAYIIDAIILGIVIGILGSFMSENATNNLGGLIGLVYVICFLALKQQTLGMMALKLKLIKEANENKMNWWAVVLLRQIVGGIVCGITLGIGFLIIFWTKKKQGLHDMIAKTYVVRE